MTIGDASSSFRRWRRTRPFWGGLFLLLAAFELFASANLTLRDLQVHFGQEGYLSYVLPAILALCGALTWATPAQRLFYGVLGLVTALYSFLGLNLGGFGIGMLLGIVGGALTTAWSPPRAPQSPPGDADTGTETPPPAGDADTEESNAPPPADDEAPADERRPSGGAHRKLLALTLVPLVVTTAVLAAGGRTPAHADTCPDGVPSRPAASSAGKPAASSSGKPAASSAGNPAASSARKSATATPAPRPAATDGTGNSFVDGWNRFVDGVGKLLGIGGSATPSPSASPSHPVSPAPSASRPDRQPNRADVPCLGPRVLNKRVSARGLPLVTARGALLEGRSLEMYDSTYDGTVSLPTADGPLRTLKFSMAKSVTKPFSLTVPEPGGRTTVIGSDALTTQGHVTFYTPRFQGKLFGLIPVTFTPDAPPPLTLPYLRFTDVRITLAFVSCDRLTADPLDLTETA